MIGHIAAKKETMKMKTKTKITVIMMIMIALILNTILNITNTDHVPSIVEALQECVVTASKRNIESVVINTPENNPFTCA